MDILNIGNCYIINYKDIVRSQRNEINVIAEHTVNTWQPERKSNEKFADTSIGKLAEDAVITLFKELNIKGYHTYDSFRTDNFENHAPFDGIFSADFNQQLIDLVNNNLINGGAGLNIPAREAIRKLNAYTVEVKSTRLAQKYKTGAKFTSFNDTASVNRLINNLMNLDFINYPHFTRYGDMTYEEYCLFAEQKIHSGLAGEELKEKVREIELLHSPDIFIRVFMDEDNKKAVIMGWIDRTAFFTPPEMRKLLQKGKSEKALYFGKGLKSGYSISKLSELL